MSSDNRELFRGTASYYTLYRPGWPQALFDHLIERFHLDGTGRLLDLGCGTGQITIPLAPHFEEAVGLDSEKEMLDEAKKAGTHNIKWVEMMAEDISDKLGEFKLTTMGISFHWMHQENVLEKVYEITQPGGGIAVIWNDSSSWADSMDQRLPWLCQGSCARA